MNDLLDNLYLNRGLLWIIVCKSLGFSYVVENHENGYFLLVHEKENKQFSYHIKNELLEYVKDIKRKDIKDYKYNGHSNDDVVEFLKQICMYNPDFNYGGFAIIKERAGLNN
ncbi:MAG: hypothetical protein BWY78_00573 [Alphaproteobacteria bacterium ADurb.Bin438]|nr:MAG: hypothetical protein BWY78_00573 [Alphaproteobacteria bacterium ADurb.Bin438]